MSPVADLIITNAKVLRFGGAPNAQAVATKEERILYVGSEVGALALKGPRTRVIDGGGKTLMPGIIDSHFHLYWGALNLTNIDLEGRRGLENLRREVQAYRRAHPDKGFLRGSGVGYDVLPGGVPLSRQQVDEIEAETPLILVAFDFHTAWCNTAALERAGLLHGAQLPSNAEVVMGEDGLASGELREVGAIRLVTDLIAKPDEAETKALIKKAIHLAHSHGITSVHNMNGDAAEFARYRTLDEAGELSLRVYMPLRIYPDTSLSVLESEALAMRDSYRSSRLKAGALKLFMDGVIEAFTGFMLDPYANKPDSRGEAIFGAEQFAEIATEADRLGLQIAVHAIGDAAVRRTLDGYEAARKTNGLRDSRHRIEHIELLHPDDLGRFAELGVLASMQPYHCSRPEEDYLTPYLRCIPEARYGDCFPWRALQQKGALLVFGSDWPVVSMNPFLGIDAAVNRRAWRDDLTSEALPLEQCLRAYTQDAAYAEFAEDKGQLRAGCLADLVLLSDNMLGMPSASLKTLRPVLTVAGGRVVYEA